MQITDLQLTILAYIADGLGAYHLVITRRERASRDRVLATLVRRSLIVGGKGSSPWVLTDEGRAKLERARRAPRRDQAPA